MILPCDFSSVDKISEYARNEPVVIPTDTLYGLAMSIYGPVERIYEVKRRPRDKRFPVGVSSVDMMREIAELSPESEMLVQKFMPGALTIVVKSRVPDITGATIGVRIPAHHIPIRLIENIGPITMTSANISGHKAPVRIEDTFDLGVKYGIDCGELSGKPSTIVSMVDGIKLIREGAIPFEKILTAMGDFHGYE